MTDSKLAQTPLHASHVAAGAKMVPFAGYEMPVQYTGVIDEHLNVRTNVGLFDVSHMGEVEFRGPGAAEVLSTIVTQDITSLADGQACYTVMCTPDAGIIDDLVVYRFAADHVLICVNAARRERDVAWMQEQNAGRCDVHDVSDQFAQIAVQGPKAAELIRRVAERDPTATATYHFVTGGVLGADCIIARTGYTGEDGFELYVPSERGNDVWNGLMEHGAELGVKPAGLGARDSLRLEMCFPLYGNDIDETTHPYEAGLGWVVKLKKGPDFIGKARLSELKQEGPRRKLSPLRILGRGIARPGYEVMDQGRTVGVVTSGTKGPSVGEAIALAYLPAESSSPGSRVDVSIRGRNVEAEVVPRPFLKRP